MVDGSRIVSVPLQGLPKLKLVKKLCPSDGALWVVGAETELTRFDGRSWTRIDFPTEWPGDHEDE